MNRTENLIARMVENGYIIHRDDGDFDLGPEPPADEYEELQAFWRFLRDNKPEQ